MPCPAISQKKEVCQYKFICCRFLIHFCFHAVLIFLDAVSFNAGVTLACAKFYSTLWDYALCCIALIIVVGLLKLALDAKIVNSIGLILNYIKHDVVPVQPKSSFTWETRKWDSARRNYGDDLLLIFWITINDAYRVGTVSCSKGWFRLVISCRHHVSFYPQHSLHNIVSASYK